MPGLSPGRRGWPSPRRSWRRDRCWRPRREGSARGPSVPDPGRSDGRSPSGPGAPRSRPQRRRPPGSRRRPPGDDRGEGCPWPNPTGERRSGCECPPPAAHRGGWRPPGNGPTTWGSDGRPPRPGRIASLRSQRPAVRPPPTPSPWAYVPPVPAPRPGPVGPLRHHRLPALRPSLRPPTALRVRLAPPKRATGWRATIKGGKRVGSWEDRPVTCGFLHD